MEDKKYRRIRGETNEAPFSARIDKGLYWRVSYPPGKKLAVATRQSCNVELTISLERECAVDLTSRIRVSQ
jgi:hypothetical protein